ncbi:MAG TPA: fibronectin type III domain-containing protein [Paludibacteraceae bacterium]|nr:fibronectin type III domain-containing protein [Paludibacteraceae bacterium]
MKKSINIFFKKNWLIFFLLFFGVNICNIQAQQFLSTISDSLTAIANEETYIKRIAIKDFSVTQKPKKVIITADERLSYIPFRPENVERIYNALEKILMPTYEGYKIVCQVDNKPIEELIPNFYRTGKKDKSRIFTTKKIEFPLVKNLSRPYEITRGLQNKHIAVWPSHGYYYNQNLARWQWQRARLLQTVEDVYTLSYVYPYLVPMLENAGANVLIPRERDVQKNEIIVDNDMSDDLSKYFEFNQSFRWGNGRSAGFSNPKNSYLDGENPFMMGTYRQILSVNNKDKVSSVEWIPFIPQSGKYAVYVSYKTLTKSTSTAHYTVYHKGGQTEFLVNQKMGGGTWIYLGTFYFNEGCNEDSKVVLTNLSSKKNEIITADAVKFGGGIGNIARQPLAEGLITNLKSSEELIIEKNKISDKNFHQDIIHEPEISGYPRFTEGSRYWLQWAGFPDSVYSFTKRKNDYIDDYQSRGLWVNYLIGGSPLAPSEKGLGIPIDLSLAFHTDAGTTSNDSIIGTLGICTVLNSYQKDIFKNKISRWTSRDLTDIIQTQIVTDIRNMYAPEWTRRGIWNKNYSESRLPEVPSMLLELLSHQNFADMRYGLDPCFQFLVSRSIYKGILKYLHSDNPNKYCVQPLPVKQFSVQFIDTTTLKLRWTNEIDFLEPTAVPEYFVVYIRRDENDFDNGILVKNNEYTVNIEPGKIYSFKVTAVNKGGESFPSEILSAYRAPDEKGEVLIVNGFTRLSAPESFSIDTLYAGFVNDKDAGVPYLYQYNFTGKQYEFSKNKLWVNDDAPGFGASYANYEGKILVGNTFDYPFLHGKAIKEAGYSFSSCSSDAIINEEINLNDYKMVDLILGKQKQTYIGNGEKSSAFKTFPLDLQRKINLFCQNGGNLFVSGANIVSDLCDNPLTLPEERSFLENTLKLKYCTHQAAVTGEVKFINSPLPFFKKINFSYFHEPNEFCYFVESPDAFEPNDKKAYTICRYSENNLSAAVAYDGNYKVCAFGFPFETIISENDRQNIMESILSFFTKH